MKEKGKIKKAAQKRALKICPIESEATRQFEMGFIDGAKANKYNYLITLK